MPIKSSVRLKGQTYYPWSDWLKIRKTAIELRRGKDFYCKPEAFVIHARTIAKGRGLRIRVKVLEKGNRILVQAVKA